MAKAPAASPQGAPTAKPQQNNPPAPRVVAQRDPSTDVSILVADLCRDVVALKRAHVGFDTLRAAYDTAMGHTPEGERKKGLPLFEFNGALDGGDTREVVKCVADLKRVNPHYLPHVLIPLIAAQAADLLEVVEDLKSRVDTLSPILKSIAGGAMGQPEPEAPPE